MARAQLTIASVALTALVLPLPVLATDPFIQRLEPDRQIVHALNRLTFGPRPGDVEEVRRVGLAKWMELQLHPEQIKENPILDEKLKPLDSLRLSLPEVVEKYTPQQNIGMMLMITSPFEALNRLPQAERNKIRNGTAEERTAALDAMEPEMRTRQVQRRSRKGAKGAAARKTSAGSPSQPPIGGFVESGPDCRCAVRREGQGSDSVRGS